MWRPLNRRHLIASALLTGLLPLLAAGSVALAASAGPVSPNSEPHGITITLLSRGTVAQPFQVQAVGIELEASRVIDVATVRVDFQPGGTTGWHVHPGPVAATVVAGNVTLIADDCTHHTYTAGQTFIEKGPRDLHKAIATGGSNAEVVATFFVPTGANPLLVPVPAPACARLG
jgi:quercetin dioxygenase-like cupin family protein